MGPAVRVFLRLFAIVVAVLLVVPGWSGEERAPRLDPVVALSATPVPLDPRDPARTRIGQLVYLGGVRLWSWDPAFGGYSSLTVDGDRFTLLSDDGNLLRFRMGADWRPHDARGATLPAGPGTGWDKRDRDSESLVVDRASGRAWVGFEAANAVMRYAPGFARGEAIVRPAAMRRWPVNGGPEAMARLPDGRFVVVSEEARVPRAAWHGTEAGRALTREALVFAGDPVTAPAPRRFAYRRHPHFDVSDATALPDGRLLVLERRFALPFRWSNILTVVAAADVRPGAVAAGTPLAVLEAPLVHDNFEGVAVTREGSATIVWLVSDDNRLPIQRTLLLKFRLEE